MLDEDISLFIIGKDAVNVPVANDASGEEDAGGEFDAVCSEEANQGLF